MNNNKKKVSLLTGIYCLLSIVLLLTTLILIPIVPTKGANKKDIEENKKKAIAEGLNTINRGKAYSKIVSQNNQDYKTLTPKNGTNIKPNNDSTNPPEDKKVQTNSPTQVGLPSKTNILRKYNLSNPSQRAQAYNEVRLIELKEQALLSKELEKPENKSIIRRDPDGKFEYQAIDPQTQKVWVYVTHDIGATIACNASEFETLDNITGQNVKVGVWDSGSVITTHQELSPRVNVKDFSTLSTHSSQVAGCIASQGIVANAKAIASTAQVDSYDWTSDLSEMISEGAASKNETNKIGVSNHSYSFATGWYKSGLVYIFTSEDDFGQYGLKAIEADEIAYSAPYYLMVRSAGNDRSENPTQGSQIKLSSRSSTISYDASIHPKGDAARKDGYDTISHAAVAKNVLTIGAVNKATLSNQRDLSRATMTSFSSWGPTDDGRIKPDLVASGSGIYTINSSSSTSYTSSFSGTSAAAPIATSICVALTQKYRELSGNAHMLSSTLKAILIATADDLGTKGPDYIYGHGHINGSASLELIKNWLSNPLANIVEESSITIQNSANKIKTTRSLKRSTGNQPIRVVVCWNDVPGEQITTKDSTRKSLVNDLETRLIDKNGNVYMPYVMPFAQTYNSLDLGLPAITGENNTDNIEVIEISQPIDGNYTLEIFSKQNLVSNQAYTVVLVGLEENSSNPQEDEYQQWLTTYFGQNWNELENTSQEQDFDQDGQPNIHEFYLGTDPTNSNSKLEARIVDAKTTPTGKTMLTIRVDPVINTGTTQLVSSQTLSQEGNLWQNSSITIQHNPNSKFVDVDVEVNHPEEFFKAIFTPTP